MPFHCRFAHYKGTSHLAKKHVTMDVSKTKRDNTHVIKGFYLY